MVNTTSSEVLIDHAVRALARRWNLSPEGALATLSDTATTLGLAIGDLAALVSAAADQHPALSLVPRTQEPTSLRAGPVRHQQLRVSNLDPTGWKATVTPLRVRSDV